MFEDIRNLGKATHICVKCEKPKKKSELRLEIDNKKGICNKCYNQQIIYELNKIKR